MFMSTCTRHPPFSVSSLVEVAGAVGVAVHLRGGAALTLMPRTVCSLGKVVSMYCTYMCVMCVYMCVCVCTYMHVERFILTREGKIVICSLDYLSLRPFPPPVSTLVCRPWRQFKSRFGLCT